MVALYNLHVVLSLIIVTTERCEFYMTINHKTYLHILSEVLCAFQQLQPLVCAKLGFVSDVMKIVY